MQDEKQQMLKSISNRMCAKTVVRSLKSLRDLCLAHLILSTSQHVHRSLGNIFSIKIKRKYEEKKQIECSVHVIVIAVVFLLLLLYSDTNFKFPTHTHTKFKIQSMRLHTYLVSIKT